MIEKFMFFMWVYRRLAFDCDGARYATGPGDCNETFFRARAFTYREAANDIQRTLEMALGICIAD